MIRASRFLRKAVEAQSPRMTIAKNILVYESLSKATTEAELDAAMKASPSVDVTNLAPGIAHMKEYLSSAPASAEGGFKKDASAWQNLPFASFVAQEAGRDMTWPFLVGGVYVFVISSSSLDLFILISWHFLTSVASPILHCLSFLFSILVDSCFRFTLQTGRCL